MNAIKKILIGVVTWLLSLVTIAMAFGQTPAIPPLYSEAVTDAIIEQGYLTGDFAFGRGEYRINKTIKIPGNGKPIGIRVHGVGQVGSRLRAYGEFNTTRLTWTGPPGVPVFDNAVMHGKFYDFTVIDAPIVVDTILSHSSGSCNFYNLTFIGDKAGIRFGDPTLNTHADRTTVRDVHFIGCRKPIELMTAQNVGYGVLDCTITDCGCGAYINGGGLIDFVRCYFTRTPYVFELDPLADGTKVGSGNGRFGCFSPRFDKSQNVKPSLVYDPSWYGTRVIAYGNIHGPAIGWDVYRKTSVHTVWMREPLSLAVVQ